VTCKTSAAVVKTLTNYEQLALSKTKSKPKLLQGFISPVHFLCCCHGKHIESTVPTDSQVMTKKNFPGEPQPSMCQLCYLFSHTYMHIICKEGRKIGKVMTRRVANK